MTWLLAVVVGIVTGLLVGGAVERLPVSPVIQTALSVLGATIAATVLMVLGQAYRPTLGEPGSVSIGVGLDNVAWLLVLTGAATGLHVLLGQVALPGFITGHLPMCFGLLAGLCGALQVAWAISIVERLQ